jgi:hypothetical protein
VIALQNPLQFISYGNAAFISEILVLCVLRNTDTLRLFLALHRQWESPTAQSVAVQFTINASSGILVENSMKCLATSVHSCGFLR